MFHSLQKLSVSPEGPLFLWDAEIVGATNRRRLSPHWWPKEGFSKLMNAVFLAGCWGHATPAHALIKADMFNPCACLYKRSDHLEWLPGQPMLLSDILLWLNVQVQTIRYLLCDLWASPGCNYRPCNSDPPLCCDCKSPFASSGGQQNRWHNHCLCQFRCTCEHPEDHHKRDDHDAHKSFGLQWRPLLQVLCMWYIQQCPAAAWKVLTYNAE